MVIAVAAGRMLIVPKPYPKEFRDDVVAIARRREVSFAQVAKDFGISESCGQNWVKKTEVEDDVNPGLTQAQSEEIRELNLELFRIPRIGLISSLAQEVLR